MAESGEFRFEIDGFTPMTLPIHRLMDYLPYLVEVFGNKDDVHLLRIDEGSAVPCIYPKEHAITRVQRRLVAIKSGHASRKAFRAVQQLNELLAEDNTSGRLRSPAFGIVIEFPGKNNKRDPLIGPITESGEIQGELFMVGGRDETISVHIRSEDEIFICTASREQGREISQYLFKQVRVHGEGKWTRLETGRWKLMSFTVAGFRPLNQVSLKNAVQSLRELGKELHIPSGTLPPPDDDD